MVSLQQRLLKPKMENQNQNPKSLLIERLKESNNVLVTVSRNPSVDQLSAAIGLTLMLNHLDKHATAVFSGEVPNTLEFLKPEETLEKNTDSLRDFIISLDKAKADKLRYKVEDKMVKIFITPYRTSLSDADLVFEQGDFNVDVVVAIGVQEKEDLDQAITAHGRILHDATVATLNTATSGQLGSINWIDTKASSLCEMLVQVCETLKAGALDAQMATAFLTGIVAETHRFSNEKTSSETMSISAKLMNSGANQQLVANKLEEPAPTVVESEKNNDKDAADGSLEIKHASKKKNSDKSNEEASDLPEIQPDHQPEVEEPQEPTEVDDEIKSSRLILQPPTLGGTLTANSKTEELDPSTDPMTPPLVEQPLLSHDNEQDVKQTPEPVEELPKDVPAPSVEPLAEIADEKPKPEHPQTLTDLEEAVDSPHLEQELSAKPIAEKPTPDADEALAAAHEAFNTAEADEPEKSAAFNSSGLMDVDHPEITDSEPVVEVPEQPVSIAIDPATGTLSYPANLVPPVGLPSDPTAGSVSDPTAPPLVPPPMAMPPLMPTADDGTLPPPTH